MKDNLNRGLIECHRQNLFLVHAVFVEMFKSHQVIFNSYYIHSIHYALQSCVFSHTIPVALLVFFQLVFFEFHAFSNICIR